MLSYGCIGRNEKFCMKKVGGRKGELHLKWEELKKFSLVCGLVGSIL